MPAKFVAPLVRELSKLSPGQQEEICETLRENPEIDAMYRKMNAEMDPAKLKLMAAEIENKVLDEAWFHPLGYFARSVPMLSKIKGYHITYTHAANNDWRGMWIDD